MPNSPVMMISIDGMDQSKTTMPHQYRKTKGSEPLHGCDSGLMFMSLDGMDQGKTGIPHEKRTTKATDQLHPFATHVVSVLVYGGADPLIAFVNMADITKNSSLTVTIIMRALELQWQAMMKKGNGTFTHWSKRLHVTFDNSQGENLNEASACMRHDLQSIFTRSSASTALTPWVDVRTSLFGLTPTGKSIEAE